MRVLVLILAVLVGLGLTLQYPFVGILLWTWFTVQMPHQEVFGFARTLPLNLIIVVVTLIALAISRENKWPQNDVTLWLIVLSLGWMTLASFFAVDPNWSWQGWDRTWRILVLALAISATAMSRVRIHAIIWVVVVSLFYYGAKGGMFTLMSGGRYIVLGPVSSIIRDNNHLALALLMVLPLANYLRTHTKNWWISAGLVAAMCLTVISVLGSYSRGAYLAMAALVIVAWWRSKNKLLFPIVAAVVIVPTLYFMPQSFYDRVGTIGIAYESFTSENEEGEQLEESIAGRLTAWHVATYAAIDHFPFGVGFSGAQLPAVFHSYFPNAQNRAAHSIYFQVLGDQGFIGLGLYIALIVLAFWHCSQIMKAARDRPELSWAGDLARMIQLSMFAFCVGGAALSMAYYDVFVIYLGILPGLRRLTAKTKSHVPAGGRVLAPAE